VNTTSTTPDFSTIMWQTLYKLLNSQIRQHPFPHWNTQDIFPYDFFLKIVSNLPKKEDYKNDINTKNTPYSDKPINKENQFIFELTEDNLSNLEKSKLTFWNNFMTAFSGDSFLLSFLKFIIPHLKKETQEYLSQNPLIAGWHLSKGDFTYNTLSDKELVSSLQFYLPSSDDLSEYGISIYSSKADNDLEKNFQKAPDSSNLPLNFEDLQKLKTFPYLSNSSFGFISGNNSFNKLENVKKESIDREILHFTLSKRI
jgi:hypothetical protein